MIRKIIIVATMIAAGVHGANAACTENAKTYTSCKPGYYLNGTSCIRCPASGGIYGTTVDKNTGDITSCYLPLSGTSFSDLTGSGVYTGNCYYSK